MHILLVSATSNEIQETLDFLSSNAEQKSFSEFIFTGNSIIPYVTGVGSPMTAFALGRYHQFTTDYRIVHAGISGSYSTDLKIGTLVEVIEERWADLGAEEENGQLLDLFELKLCKPNQMPFKQEWIAKKNNKFETDLLKCKGLTVNRTSGRRETIQQIRIKYKADVESMEGAAVFYASRMWDIPFVSIRSISNLIEPRNRDHWNIPLALKELNSYLVQFLTNLN
ncbi:MAG: futalosine hydrolase [Saprospiraceae bacterium]